MVFYILAALLLALFLVPVWMRSVFERTSDVRGNRMVWIFLGFELCLATVVFLSFFSAWFSYSLMANHVVPWVVDVHIAGLFWDAPLTPRGLAAMAFVFGFPLLVFFRVGLISVRDVHQLCKEQRARLRKEFSVGFLLGKV